MTPLSRSNLSPFGRWFWTIDKVLLTLVFALMGCGVIAVAAASPAIAQRLSGGKYHPDALMFLNQQLRWVLLGIPAMLATSMLSVPWAKRVGIAATVACLAALLLVPLFGVEIKGAVRWLLIGGFQFQPSEFLKPAFIVTSAWLLALRFDDKTLPTMQANAALLAIIAVLLVKQPDFGQTILFGLVWVVQAMLAGMSIWVLVAFAVFACIGGGIAYLTVDHFAQRIDQFVKGTGNTFQIERALDCFRAGGFFGAAAQARGILRERDEGRRRREARKTRRAARRAGQGDRRH